MEYFSRLNINFDNFEEDSDPQDDEPSTESGSSSSSLSSSSSSLSSTSPSSDPTEEQKISTPDGSNHSIGTPETSDDDDEESVDLNGLFSGNDRVMQYQGEEVKETKTDEPRRQSCPDPHTLHKIAMRYMYLHESDDGKLSLSDSALVVEKELAWLMFHINPDESYGRMSYVANSYANAAA